MLHRSRKQKEYMNLTSADGQYRADDSKTTVALRMSSHYFVVAGELLNQSGERYCLV